MKKVLLVVFIAAVVLVAALGIMWLQGGRPPTAAEVRPVSVRMKWFFAGTMTAWFSGVARGTFEENGLALTLNPGGPQNSAIKLIAAGSDEFGVTGADELLLARAAGVPVVAVAVLFKENPVCYVSRASSGISAPVDWRGRTIEVAYGENTEYIFRALLKREGLTSDDYREVPYTYSLAPFVSGSVDVSPVYAMDQAIVLERQGIELSMVCPKTYGINPYGDVVVTTEDMLEREPELVRRFVEAAITAHEWAMSRPAEAVISLVAAVPDLADSNPLDVWTATIPYLEPSDDMAGVGVMTMERWAETQAVLLESGALAAPVDLPAAFRNITRR